MNNISWTCYHNRLAIFVKWCRQLCALSYSTIVIWNWSSYFTYLISVVETITKSGKVLIGCLNGVNEIVITPNPFRRRSTKLWEYWGPGIRILPASVVKLDKLFSEVRIPYNQKYYELLNHDWDRHFLFCILDWDHVSSSLARCGSL